MKSNIVFEIETKDQLAAVEALYKAYGYKWSDIYEIGHALRLETDPILDGGHLTSGGYSDPAGIWKDRVAAILRSRDQPLLIAGYKTDVGSKGVQVGCTFVPWEQVDQLVKARKAKGY